MGNKKNRNKVIFPTTPTAAPIQNGSYTIAAKQEVQFHIGPLPAPSVLERYNQIVPGSAERILIMAEKQMAHRIEMEKLILPSREKQSKRGQLFAFISCLLIASISMVAIIYNHPVVASLIFTSALVLIVAMFLNIKKIPAIPQNKQ